MIGDPEKPSAALQLVTQQISKAFALASDAVELHLFSSPVEAYEAATLAVLGAEIRSVLQQADEWDFEPANVELALKAMDSNSRIGTSESDLVEGLYAIFTLGGLYSRKAKGNPRYSKLEDEFERCGYLLPAEVSLKSDPPQHFSSNCKTIGHFVEIETRFRIKERAEVQLADMLDISLLETIDDGLEEAWSHMGSMGPHSLLDPRLKSYSGLGWIFCYGNAFWMSAFPGAATFDEKGLLHSAIGPAIKFSCGSELFAWHGDLVPKDWINGRPTMEDLKNVESAFIDYAEIGHDEAARVLSEIIQAKK